MLFIKRESTGSRDQYQIFNFLAKLLKETFNLLIYPLWYGPFIKAPDYTLVRTLSYRIAVADGISVVVNQFLKINKRGGKCMEICSYSLHTETIPRKLINVADGFLLQNK